jgi:glutamine amidotransferase
VSSTIAVLDYGSGNLHSVAHALSATGVDVRLVRTAAEAQKAAGLVVPGVGAFAACMDGLRAINGDDLVRDWVGSGRPLLGICVGHQILFSSGTEHGVVSAGIGIFDGTVERLEAKRLPHMGWNTVHVPAESVLFAGVTQERFYFVHSYAVRQFVAEGARVTWATHEDDRFVAGIERDNVFATQFHPEKSGAAGARLLSNWIRVCEASA